MSQIKTTKQYSKQARESVFLLLAASVASLFIYSIHFDSTALTWPAIDNLPAVCRMLDSTCLSSDFFTNASSEPNPRLPYIYLLSILTDASGNGIGGGLAIIKSILLAIMPFTLTIVVATATQASSDLVSESRKPTLIIASVIAAIIVVLLQGKIGALLSVAWWPPLYFDATPQNVSFVLTLIGFLLIIHKQRLAGAILIFSAGVVHPAICIFSTIFAYILYSRSSQTKANAELIKLAIVPGLVAALFVKIIFDRGVGVDTTDFIRIYVVEAAPSHYLLSQFGSLSGLPWELSFSIVIVSLIVISAGLYKLRNEAWVNALVAAISYATAVLMQYIFIEVWPTKMVAALGPSRFTMFGPWFLAIFLLILLLTIYKRSSLPNIGVLHIQWFTRPGINYIAGVFLFITCVIYAGKAYQFSFFNEEVSGLFEFVKKKSEPSDVFSLPHGSPVAFLPLVTGRAVFIGNGFPFSQSSFMEYEKRKTLLYGNNDAIMKISGSWIGEKYANFYRSLTPSSFVSISEEYQLNLVVVDAKYSEAFRGCNAEYISNEYKVFDMASLRQCAIKQPDPIL
jgi:hypothetical protein